MSKRNSGIQSKKTILKISNKDKQREHGYHNPVLADVPLCFQGVTKRDIDSKWVKSTFHYQLTYLLTYLLF